MSLSNPSLFVKHLSGQRSGRILFKEVDFILEPGDVLEVTGKNGTGKSTLLRILAGLLPVSSGEIRLTDHTFEQPCEAMHYLGHANALKPSLSVGENLQFWQAYFGHEKMTPDQALKQVRLGDIAHIPAAYLSAGQKRRVAIAKLLVSHRPIWIVDEPTSTLDKASDTMFASIVEAHCNEGGSVIAATHKNLGIKNAKTLNMDVAH